jgi:hypothetical protein
MSADNLIGIFRALIIFGTPAAALTVRWVFRPMLRDIADAIRTAKQPLNPEIERRLMELEEGQQLIGQQLERLIEAERFKRELQSGEPE